MDAEWDADEITEEPQFVQDPFGVGMREEIRSSAAADSASQENSFA